MSILVSRPGFRLPLGTAARVAGIGWLAFGLAAFAAADVSNATASPGGHDQASPSDGAAPPLIPDRSQILDPEHPEPVIGFWSNGVELLELAPEGTYRLFDTQNRYRKPVEVGRWSRQNYATLWLEPYTARKEERSRIALSKLGEKTTLSVRKYRPMIFLTTPPLCEEDFVIGLWVGKGGTLELEPSMRYRYVTPTRPDEAHPVVIASHRGTWRLNEGRVELLPDSPSVAKTLFEPARDDEGRPYMRLKGVEGMLDRVVDRTLLAPIRPAPADATSPPSDAQDAAPSASPR